MNVRKGSEALPLAEEWLAVDIWCGKSHFALGVVIAKLPMSDQIAPYQSINSQAAPVRSNGL